VPGAFMTLITSSILSQALQQCGPRDPASLLAEVSRGVKNLLGQQDAAPAGALSAGSNDGMDAGFLWFDQASSTLHFAGARMALYLLEPGQPAVQAIDGDRMGVGYTDTPADYCWHNHSLSVHAGSLLLLTTDGLIDQIGGPRDIAYGKRRMRDVLLAQRDASASEAASALLGDFLSWQGAQPRRDDLTFFCFRP